MWAYTSVFASSLAANVPLHFLSDVGKCDIEKDSWEECGSHYLFFLAIFTVIVLPLGMLDLKEQRIVQVIMTAGNTIPPCPHCMFSLPHAIPLISFSSGFIDFFNGWYRDILTVL